MYWMHDHTTYIQNNNKSFCLFYTQIKHIFSPNVPLYIKRERWQVVIFNLHSSFSELHTYIVKTEISINLFRSLVKSYNFIYKQVLFKQLKEGKIKLCHDNNIGGPT